MLLQTALNGGLTKADHPAVPITLDELAADAAACVAAGARAFHLHPRDASGEERLDAATVDRAVVAARRGQSEPVGVSTGAWIEPQLSRRVALISQWREPDYATVNVCEEGSAEVMRALLSADIAVEAGVWTLEDAETLLATGMAERMLRICIEPLDVRRDDALSAVAAIHEVFDRAAVSVPRLQHGDGEATRVLIEDAVRRGIATRVGFEDTFELPDGSAARSNAELVRAAYELGASGHADRDR